MKQKILLLLVTISIVLVVWFVISPDFVGLFEKKTTSFGDEEKEEEQDLREQQTQKEEEQDLREQQMQDEITVFESAWVDKIGSSRGGLILEKVSGIPDDYTMSFSGTTTVSGSLFVTKGDWLDEVLCVHLNDSNVIILPADAGKESNFCLRNGDYVLADIGIQKEQLLNASKIYEDDFKCGAVDIVAEVSDFFVMRAQKGIPIGNYGTISNVLSHGNPKQCDFDYWN